jgi:uroporphyrinogen decarboxylase
MTSRERVLTALAHEEPDRVPIDLGGSRCSGIHALAYARLRDHLGLGGRPFRMYDVMQQLADPEPEILDRLNIDTVQVHRLRPVFGMPIDRWKQGCLPDGTPCLVPYDYAPLQRPDGTWRLHSPDGTEIARMSADGGYFERSHFPLAEARTPEEIDQATWPPVTDEEIALIRSQALRLRSESDRAIVMGFGGNILEAGNNACGFQNFMVRLAEDPELVEALFSRVTRWYLESLDRLLPAIEGLVDVIMVGDDLGTQESLIVSPAMYRRLIKPYQAQVYSRIRAGSSARLMLHSCGAIEPIIGDLIEIGVQVLNPVQISAAGMDPIHLKKTYGRHLTFWGGGCDTQVMLPRAPLDELARHVRALVEVFKPGGGFVFTQVHNILANVAPERILTVYETAYKAG